MFSVSASAENYEQHIQRFASNTPPETVRTALRTLEQAGTNAFPALLANLRDRTPAARDFFQRAEGSFVTNGIFKPAIPTVGDACFGLLQSQIEGNWPKGFRHYYVLSPANAGEWLARYKGLPLQRLRVEAAQQSLRRAEADASKKKSDNFHQQTLKFLRQNLEDARQRKD